MSLYEGCQIRRTLLAQSRINSTTATSILAGASKVLYIPQIITLCNTTASDATFRLYFHATGTTYDQTTAIFYDDTVLANKTILLIEGVDFVGMYLDTSTGNIAWAEGTANAITLTMWGLEIKFP